MRNQHTPLSQLPDFCEVAATDAKAYCAQSIAFILATDMRTAPVVVNPDVCTIVATDENDNVLPRPLQTLEGRTLLAHTLAHVAPCFAKTFVLVREGLADLQAAAQADLQLASCDIEFVEVNYALELAITKAGFGFDIVTITKGRLSSIHSVLDTYLNAQPKQASCIDSVCIFTADQPLIGPRHIITVQEEFRGMERTDFSRTEGLPSENQKTTPRTTSPKLKPPRYDVAASWIEWRRVLPLIISRECLEQVCADEFPGVCKSGQPALPSLHLHDVLFGEEKLNGYLVLPPKNDEWLEQFSLSMPQTLQKARAYRRILEESNLSADVLDEDFDPESLADDEQTQTAYKKLLAFKPQVPQLEYALRVLDDISAAQVSVSCEERAQWNAWAFRNRLDFPLLMSEEHKDRTVYLDSAATAQRPNCVLRAQEAHESHANANIWRGYYKLANDCTFAFEGARAQIAAFINAKPTELFFTQNTTTSINQVANIWAQYHIKPGDLIVCGIAEHHSNMLPWMLLCERQGARLAFIPYTPEGRYDQETYEHLLQQNPKLVSFALIGNTLGLQAPAQAMIAAAHEHGARVCVDAAQALAHMPIDVKALDCDFLAFSSHKAYGPTGIGGLYVHERIAEEINPSTLGGGTVSNVTEEGYYLRLAPAAFEAGTPPITQAIGLAKATEYLQALGMENVQTHARLLSLYAMGALETLPGVTVIGDQTGKDGCTGVISFRVANINCLNVSKSLGELAVDVRGGSHCAMPLTARLGVVGTLRVSIGVYNTFDDIDALTLALSHVIDHYKEVEPRP